MYKIKDWEKLFMEELAAYFAALQQFQTHIYFQMVQNIGNYLFQQIRFEIVMGQFLKRRQEGSFRKCWKDFYVTFSTKKPS